MTDVSTVMVPTTTARDLKRVARANKLHNVFVFAGTNLGRDTLTARMTIAEFHELSVVGNRDTVNKEDFSGEFIAQRKLIPAHARGLALYVLRGLVVSAIFSRQAEGKAVQPEIYKIRDDLAGGPYAALQPIVANIRNIKFDDLPMEQMNSALPLFRITLASSQRLWIVDGQHRREAFGMVFKYLEELTKHNSYPKAKSTLYNPNIGETAGKLNSVLTEFWHEVHDLTLNECSVTVEIHVGLGAKEEGQLFADLNSRGKTLQASLLAQFDKSDAIAALIADTLTDGDNPVIRFPIHDESDQKNWNSAGMTLKDVVMVTRLLVHGSNSAKATPPTAVREKQAFIEKFWTVVQSIPGFGYEGQRAKTVAGQPVVIKALAKLSYDHAYGTPKLRDEQGLTKLYDAILSKTLSFNHEGTFWHALFIPSEKERDEFLPGINEYLYLGDQFKGGEFDPRNRWVRYGPAHNDIYPRLGDVIRWKLGLKNRGAAAKARGKIAPGNEEEELPD